MREASVVANHHTECSEVRSKLFGISDAYEVVNYHVVQTSLIVHQYWNEHTRCNQRSEDVGFQDLPCLFYHEHPRADTLSVAVSRLVHAQI